MDLLTILKEEQSIFEVFSNFEHLAGGLIFGAPILIQYTFEPCLPCKFIHKIELKEIKSFYAKLNLDPHIVRFEKPKNSQLIAEEVEYFWLPKKVKKNPFDQPLEQSVFEVNLEEFCNLVGMVFSFDQKTKAFFQFKMNLLNRRQETRFCLIKKEC